MKQRVYTGLRLKTHFKQALFNSTKYIKVSNVYFYELSHPDTER